MFFSRGDSRLELAVMPNIDLAHRLFEDPIERIWQSVLLNADARRVFQKTNISSNFQQNSCLFYFQHLLLKHPEIIRKLFNFFMKYSEYFHKPAFLCLQTSSFLIWILIYWDHIDIHMFFQKEMLCVIYFGWKRCGCFHLSEFKKGINVQKQVRRSFFTCLLMLLWRND